MKVTMMLADYAQVIEGKLYIMGGGWSITGPQPMPSAIAMKVEVPWTQTNQKHTLKLELLDSDFRPVSIETGSGLTPVVIGSEFEVGRPPGLPPGIPIDLPFAVNLPPIPLAPGKRYVWKLKIDDQANDAWQIAFSTRSVQTQPVAR